MIVVPNLTVQIRDMHGWNPKLGNNPLPRRQSIDMNSVEKWQGAPIIPHWLRVKAGPLDLLRVERS